MYENDKFIQKVYSNVSIDEFYGDVLYLGMGPLWLPRHQTHKVTSTIIIENDKKIINQFSKFLKPEWVLIEADAWEYKPSKNFDIIYADIWHRIINYEEVYRMFDKYKDYLKPNGQIKCLERLIRNSSIPNGETLTFKNTSK